MIRILAATLLVAGIMAARPSSAAEPVRLYAAGSLRAALTEIARTFERAEGVPTDIKFGASGTLSEAIAKGADAEVFASANMDHPRSLAEAGKSGPAILFARNRLCALARPGVDASTTDLISRMLDPAVRLGTSTPKADPAGDYAWEVFRKIERERPGSFALLDGKALKLTGGPTSAPAPAGRSVYGRVLEQGQADLFLTYCTNAREAGGEVPGAREIELPDSIAVGADYGLAVMKTSSVAGYRAALFLLSPPAQAILARHGFSAPTALSEGDIR